MFVFLGFHIVNLNINILKLSYYHGLSTKLEKRRNILSYIYKKIGFEFASSGLVYKIEHLNYQELKIKQSYTEKKNVFFNLAPTAQFLY
jgi:hypothetical protein